MPMFKMGQDQYGKLYVEEYFMRGSRGQYGGEGYITAGLCIFTSLSFLLMIKADEFVKTPIERRAVICGAIMCAGLGIYTYLYCYRIKTPWYANDFWPPEGYTKGPIMRDQGNNI